MTEMQRSSLLGVVLGLKTIGIDNVLGFGFIDPADTEMEMDAIRQLFLLGALDENGKLTKDGSMMADFAVSPHLARALIAAARDHGCADEMLTIAAMLSVEDIWVSPRGEAKKGKAAEKRKKLAHRMGDHMTLLRVYRTWEALDFSKDWCFDNYIHHRALRAARNIRGQLSSLLEKLGFRIERCRLREKKRYRDDPDESDPKPILKSLCAAFYTNLARQQRDRPFFVQYSTGTVLGKGGNDGGLLALHLQPNSALFSESLSITSQLDWVIYTDISYTSRANMRNVSRVDVAWAEPYLTRIKLMDDEKLSGHRNASKQTKPDAPIQPRPRRPSMLELMEERGAGASTPGLKESVEHRQVRDEDFVVVHEQVTESNHSEVISPEVARQNGEIDEVDSKKRKEREDSVLAARDRYLARKKMK